MHSEFVAIEAARFVLREYNSTMGTNRGYFLFIFFSFTKPFTRGGKKTDSRWRRWRRPNAANTSRCVRNRWWLSMETGTLVVVVWLRSAPVSWPRRTRGNTGFSPPSRPSTTIVRLALSNRRGYTSGAGRRFASFSLTFAFLCDCVKRTLREN